MSRFDNLEINASPVYITHCPKCHNRMTELQDGWFSEAFWCKKCEQAYKIKLAKCKFDIELVNKQLQPTPTKQEEKE